MNKLQIFNYNDAYVRTVENDGETWWVLKDVCDVLEITNSRNVAERLDDDELTSAKLTSGGQNREMHIVNESGLYSVILRSDKPEAKQFKRWVTHEVLPSIRKKGGYNAKSGNGEKIRLSNHYLKLSKIEDLELIGKNRLEYVQKAVKIMEDVE